ncbi:hypothetical protein [Micromonospora aurantiaca]|uniref:hypothetical protein n=1 Tax=Micromonospora aurantiaca (nom. illeg.) TaxID=47850 RepID=UPI0011CEBBFE|nr:hypothetical protein [Micromonospora aurantiaca]
MVFEPRTRDAVVRALIDVEAAHERRGWDLAPTLVGVFDLPPSSPRQGVHVDAGLFGPNVWHNPVLAHGDPTLPPGAILHSLADLLATAPARPKLRGVAEPRRPALRRLRSGLRSMGRAEATELPPR